MNHNHFNARYQLFDSSPAAESSQPTVDPRKPAYVVQIFNLLYRRFATGGGQDSPPSTRRLKIDRPPAFLFLLLLSIVASRADSLSGDNGKDKVKNVVPMKAEAFPLGQVRLLDEIG